ncbi:hypothetical protein ATCC90586_007168 [Pythium insidiosum]|nr:hypothetical protein ATCC90586_007168 [Pythium insidiosum]
MQPPAATGATSGELRPTLPRAPQVPPEAPAATEPARRKDGVAGELATLSARQVANIDKLADQFVLDSNELLRLVVPPDMRRDVLHVSHKDYQGGHQGITRTYDRVRGEYYWPRMFRDVEEHVCACVDCATAKGRPPNPGPSPGDVRAEYPFQVLTIDFVMQLPESANGITALLLFQDQFSGFVMSAYMSD